MNPLKKIIKRIHVLNKSAAFVNNLIGNARFPGTAIYWENHYQTGGNSGSGSYNRLANFKAQIINDFIKEKGIATAMEFGCGDGSNLRLINYPKYIGLDIAPSAIKMCIQKFKNDTTKSFYVYNSLAFSDNHQLFNAEITLSLDVIYHLIEDELFDKYMNDLFNASQKYVIIYSRDYSENQVYHQKSRNFSKWVNEYQKSFKMIKKVENPYKYNEKDPNNTSNALFMIYEKF